MPDDASRNEVAVFSQPRIPFHPLIEERFGVDRAGWRALIDAVWPAAKTADAVTLALSYCKARNLDPFKRPVHIVPVWSSEQNRWVESVWPGIGELRTTAFRTGLYAGRDVTEYGPDKTENLGGAQITFPEWAQVTVYRLGRNGERMPFPGPRVYWLETYATAKRDTLAPNAMWRRRSRGQIDKCAEAAALRAAFPEEMGNDQTADEMEGQVIDHAGPARGAMPSERPRLADYERPHEPEPKPEAKTYTIVTSDGEYEDFADPIDAAHRLGGMLADARRGGLVAIEAVWVDNQSLMEQLRADDAVAAQFVTDAYEAECAELKNPSAPDDPAQSPVAMQPDAPPRAAGDSSPRPRGRPPGSRNKPSAKDTSEDEAAAGGPAETLAPAIEEYVADPLATGEPDVLVKFDAQGNIQEWFGRGRQRLRDLQAAGAAPDRFTAYRKANAAPLERLKRELLSWWQHMEEIIANGERPR
jgi:phage recombination protein Bet